MRDVLIHNPTDDVDDWDSHWESFSAAIGENPAQAYRRRIVSAVAAGARPARVLDIGSGQGDLLARLAKVCPRAELHGLELSQVGVDETLAKVPGAQVIQIDLLAEGATERIAEVRADFATCVEVLEHLDDPLAFLRVAKAALVPGATLVVTVPGGPQSAFDHVIGHRRHYRPRELRRLLQNAGFVVRRVDGVGFPLFNLYRLVIIARGEHLATDIERGSTKTAAAAMRLFGRLFQWCSDHGRFGWQTVAVATVAFT